MKGTPDNQRQLIVEQFTQQAAPFAQAPAMSNEQTNRLVIETVGIHANDTVLDVACGPGLITCAIAKIARHVTGIDITPAMIDQAKARQNDNHLLNMDWCIGDVPPLPFGDGSFSAVITRYSLHHFPDPKAVLAEMVRVCQPGGRVAVVDLFASQAAQALALNRVEKLRDPSHTRVLLLKEVTSLFEECSLQNLQTAFYKLEIELESQLARSFPKPGDADDIREIFRKDLDVNQLGLGATRRDKAIHFAYPVVILVGQKVNCCQ